MAFAEAGRTLGLSDVGLHVSRSVTQCAALRRLADPLHMMERRHKEKTWLRPEFKKMLRNATVLLRSLLRAMMLRQPRLPLFFLLH